MHVEGVVRPRGPDDEEDPLTIDMRCLVCGAFWRAQCYSGRWDRRIEKFALVHKPCWFGPVP